MKRHAKIYSTADATFESIFNILYTVYKFQKTLKSNNLIDKKKKRKRKKRNNMSN